MSGFATYDQFINAATVNAAAVELAIDKTPLGTPTVLIPYSLWRGTGNPGAGAAPTAGVTNGRVCTVSTAGAIPFPNPSSGTTHLVAGGGAIILPGADGATSGTWYVFDRVADVNILQNEGSASITGCTATSRLKSTSGAGDGCQIFIEVNATLGTSTTFTLGYTNEKGTSSKTTQNIVTTASQAVDKSCNSRMFQGLADGDVGVRSIDSVTAVSGSGAGRITVCLVRPLGTIVMPTRSYCDIDYVLQLPRARKIFNSSCLMLVWVGAVQASAPTFFGNLKIVQN